MISTVENISSTKKRFTIEIPQSEIEKEYIASLESVRMKARIPGFRQGKAPVSMIEKRFGGDIKSDLIDRLVPRYFTKAIKDAELVPVTMPSLEGEVDISRDKPFIFSFSVEVRPEISNLNYSGLKVEGTPAEVGESEIEETLKSLQEQKAVFEVVDREVRQNDLLVIDYVKLDPEGKKEISSATDQVMNLGNNLAPPGILEQVLGKKKGEVAEVIIPEMITDEKGQPKEGESDKALVRITVKEIKEKNLPEIDDEFARDLGHDSLEDTKGKIREGLLKAKESGMRRRQKEQILNTLLESHEFEVPESLLNQELEKLVVNERLTAEGEGNKGDNEAAVVPEAAVLAERLMPDAMRNMKSSILLDMIADKENVRVTEEEVKTRIMLIAQQLKATPEAIINFFRTRDGSLDGLVNSIKEDKVLDLVLSKAENTKGA